MFLQMLYTGIQEGFHFLPCDQILLSWQKTRFTVENETYLRRENVTATSTNAGCTYEYSAEKLGGKHGI